MRVITMARKPPDGTTVATVERWGIGGLNIDGCRIKMAEGDEVTVAMANLENRRGQTGVDWRKKGQDKMAQAQRESVEKTNRLGRFPSNLILEHAPGCACVGSKRVKGSNANLMDTPAGHNIGLVSLRGLKRVPGFWGQADADGFETVPDWACSPNCPIAALEAENGRPKGVVEEGTVTRFFKQVKR